MHVGVRDEKIAIRQALRFSTAKFLSFFSAPIIPLLIILAVGIVVAIGGLLLNVPWIGPIIVGVLFFLALVAGFVMTLVAVGMAGGLNLMYPTIAVEGSDSFDAISRSFSYLYARPWRLAFYSALAIVYGSICYLFVHYFVFLMLSLTHWFMGLLVFYHAENTALLWNVIWPMPTSGTDLTYDISYLSLGSGDAVGAFFVSLWVYLVIGLLGAFAISFYFSINTIIYYLMRREVDATEMDDVYLEQSDDDFADSVPGATTVEVTTTTVTVPVGTSPTAAASPQASPDVAPNATTESSSENPPA